MSQLLAMPGISTPEFINGQWVMVVRRANGTEYRVWSTDRQSAFDYRREFVSYHNQKRR